MSTLNMVEITFDETSSSTSSNNLQKVITEQQFNELILRFTKLTIAHHHHHQNQIQNQNFYYYSTILNKLFSFDGDEKSNNCFEKNKSTNHQPLNQYNLQRQRRMSDSVTMVASVVPVPVVSIVRRSSISFNSSRNNYIQNQNHPKTSQQILKSSSSHISTTETPSRNRRLSNQTNYIMINSCSNSVGQPTMLEMNCSQLEQLQIKQQIQPPTKAQSNSTLNDSNNYHSMTSTSKISKINVNPNEMKANQLNSAIILNQQHHIAFQGQSSSSSSVLLLLKKAKTNQELQTHLLSNNNRKNFNRKRSAEVYYKDCHHNQRDKIKPLQYNVSSSSAIMSSVPTEKQLDLNFKYQSIINSNSSNQFEILDYDEPVIKRTKTSSNFFVLVPKLSFLK